MGSIKSSGFGNSFHFEFWTPICNFIRFIIPGIQKDDLVFGVVAAVEEEKDPRCLLLAFRITRLLAKLYPDPEGPVASCAEELFDVVSRYFPISFNPVSIFIS